MKKAIPVLLLCALLCLAACGKQPAGETGSGSAEPTTAAQKTEKAPAKDEKQGSDAAKATAAPTAQPAAQATAAGTTQPAAATPTPAAGATQTPAAQPTSAPTAALTQEELEKMQQELLEKLSVNPVGSWTDPDTGTMMVIDEDFRGSILRVGSDGSNTVWLFSGTYDPGTGVLSYTNCAKQVMQGSSLKTVYEKGSGTLSVKDGGLVWQDDQENAGNGVTFQRDD